MFVLKVDQDIELQLFQKRHAKELFYLVDSNRSHLREWLPWVDSMVSYEQYYSVISIWLKQFAEDNGFNAGIRYKGELCGCVGFHEFDWSNGKTSLGYYLAKGFEGKGIMSKTVRALTNYAFFELGLNRVEIRCGVGNKKSRNIPERLGFVQEGIIRDGEFLYDHHHDLAVYGMLKHEWKA